METRKMKLALSAGALALSLALAGCGGGGSAQAPADPRPPTPYEMAEAAIAAANTPADVQMAVDDVKDEVTGTEADDLQDIADARIMALDTMARAAAQKTALSDAAGMVDTSDLSTQDAVDNARTAIAALRQAIADAVDVDDTSMYQSMLDDAVDAVDMAQGGIDTATRRTNQMATLSGASDTLQAALAALSGSTPTQAQLDAANNALTALNGAITAGADLTDGEKAPYQREADNAAGPISMAQMAFDDAEDEADKMMRADMANTGKALHAALAGPANDGSNNALVNQTGTALTATDLKITAAAGAGSLPDDTTPAPSPLKAGNSAGMLGSWVGMDYAHMDTTTKVKNEARVYTNQGPAKSVAFDKAGHTIIEDAGAGANKGMVAVTSADHYAHVMATAFNHSGTQTHSPERVGDPLYIRGTYDGAPGEYRCTGDCSSTNDGKGGSPSALGGTWHFKPDAGAMVSQPDAEYLYFGWWVSKDKDGNPTAASAFTGVNGTIAGLTDDPASAVTGSATYAGKAAGKFAMSNPLDGTGSGGHFTADAMLTAKFGSNGAPNNGGVSGTIDNFMANGEAVSWSVELHRAQWGTAGEFTSTSVDTDTIANGTTWSIDGNPAPESGTWSGQMYDELPGLTTGTPPGDGSNIPTTVTGTFYSEFSAIGRMVGAFGANKQ